MKIDPGLAQFLISTAITEVMGIVRERHAATGDLPTDQEVIDRMKARADRIVEKADAFLRES